MLAELQDLLSISKKNERNKKIRERLRPYNEPLAVDGYESQFCLILLNLGYSTKHNVDLLDSESASSFITDKDGFPKAVLESEFFHSHNPKYPDIRVREQVIRASVIEQKLDGICSNSVINCIRFGYANNGNCVSKVLPLISEFFWNGKVTFLAELICQNEITWTDNLIKLGLSEELLEVFKSKLSESLSPVMPDRVCNSIQLRFKNGDDYVAVTPVISHTLSSQLQKLCSINAFKYRTISHPRMTNAGSFLTSIGGRFKVLNYYPNTRNIKAVERINRFNDNEQPFKYFHSGQFIKALRALAFPSFYLTLRLKRLARIAAIKCIRRTFHLWIYKFMHIKKYEDIELLITGLCNLLHSQLSSHEKTQVFAYHPKLLKVCKSQIRYVIQHPKKSKPERADPFIYLHLKELVVEGVNTMSNQYLWGVPSVISLAGFTHEFERNLSESFGEEVKISGAALFVHSYEVSSESSLPEYDRIVKINGKYLPQRPALIDIPKSTMKFDLVIKIKAGKKLVNQQGINELFFDAIPDRIMGGEINFGSGITDKKCTLISDSEMLYKSIEQQKYKGCWLYPTTLKPKNLDEMSALLNDNFSLKPCHVGYAFLERPKPRKGAICSKHCFAESVLGLIRCVSQAELFFEGHEHFFNNAFWSLKTSDSSLIMSNAGAIHGYST